MAWSDNLNLGSTDPRLIVSNLIGSAMGYLGIIVVVIVLWAGFKWMVSGGDDAKVADAKKTLVSLIIGLTIILSSYSIINFVIKSVTSATGAS